MCLNKSRIHYGDVLRMNQFKQDVNNFMRKAKHWKKTQWDFFVSKEFKPWTHTPEGHHWLEIEEIALCIALILVLLLSIIGLGIMAVIVIAVFFIYSWFKTQSAIARSNKDDHEHHGEE